MISSVARALAETKKRELWLRFLQDSDSPDFAPRLLFTFPSGGTWEVDMYGKVSFQILANAMGGVSCCELSTYDAKVLRRIANYVIAMRELEEKEDER